MEPKTGKRIVSQGRYVFIKSLAVCLSACIVVCSMSIVRLFSILPYSAALSAKWQDDCLEQTENCEVCMSLTGNDAGLGYIILIVLLIVAAFLLRRVSQKSWKTVHTMQPVDNTCTGDLPDPDTLVRASSEPVQAQEAVLLRAAAEGQGTPPEQLLRPAETMTK